MAAQADAALGREDRRQPPSRPPQFARLRRQGWLVLRVWGHDVLADAERVADRIEEAVRGRMPERA